MADPSRVSPDALYKGLVPRAEKELQCRLPRDSADTCPLQLPRYRKGQACRLRFSAREQKGSAFHRAFEEFLELGSAAIVRRRGDTLLKRLQPTRGSSFDLPA